MASTNVPAGGSPGNPTITDIEPVIWLVAPDHDVGGVKLEVADRDGNGFTTIFDQDAALDITLRFIGAIARLRVYGGAP
jgi:hypothetical protein